MKLGHNPFGWIHSEFAYVITLVVATGAFLIKGQDASISTFFEFLVAFNTLFWVKKFTNRKTESDTQVKLATITNGASDPAGKTGDPLA